MHCLLINSLTSNSVWKIKIDLLMSIWIFKTLITKKNGKLCGDKTTVNNKRECAVKIPHNKAHHPTIYRESNLYSSPIAQRLRAFSKDFTLSLVFDKIKPD